MRNQSPKYNQIIEAAVTVIAENGYHASQVSRIAKQAGVADGTIYLYFKNKEDILVSVFEEKMGEFTEEISRGISQANRADEKLFKLIHLHFRQLSEHHHLAIVTQLELRQSDTRLRLKINEVLKPYLTIIDDIIKEGVADKRFRNDLNVPLIRQMIFGMLDEIVTNWVMKEQKYDLAGEAHDVHAFITDGLSANN